MALPKEGMLPASLISPSVQSFKDIKCLNVDALEKLTSLQEFNLSYASFGHLLAEPKVLRLPSTLTALTLSGLYNLESSEDIGIQSLACLQHLRKFFCCVKSLPATGLPESLLVLSIDKCSVGSLLRLKKGKEWSKVSHIQCVRVDGELLTWSFKDCFYEVGHGLMTGVVYANLYHLLQLCSPRALLLLCFISAFIAY